VLRNRLRRTGVLVLLRLTGLTLAAVLAAAVPVFVSSSMEQTLHKQIAAKPDALSIVLDWSASDTDDHSVAVKQLDTYLRTTFPADGGVAAVNAVTIPSTGQRPVQVVGADGKLQPGKKYFTLGVLPELPSGGVSLVTGRLPAAGKAEVAVPDAALAKAGYKLGDKLRVPLTSDSAGAAATVTIVGTVALPETGLLAELKGVLDSGLLTGQAYWDSLAVTPGQVTWAMTMPTAEVHAARVPALAAAVRELPLRAARLLPDVDVAASPASFLDNFLTQMATTQRMLTVLLLPVYLLVVFFVLATADVVVSSRQVEVAVLRSRGVHALETVWFYLGESLLLAGGAALLGLLLTLPVVRVMGLSAGFLQLVDRPLLPVTLTWAAAGWAAGAALVAELISLVPLVRAARFTVATLGQEAAKKSPALEALRAAAEVALLAVLGYGTWKLFAAGGGADDPLFLSLPALALVGVGVVIWRVMTLALQLLTRLAGRRLSPPFYLALSLLRSKPGRYQSLWLMLVVTTGLGIYGAAFARTLDRDLVARAQYETGSDLLLSPAWESEVLSYDASGNPDEIVYREPPYSNLQNLPDTVGSARVQTRKGVSLSVGSKNLGKADLVGIQPQEFGKVARFIPELTPYPPADYLNLLAKDEQAVLVSSSLAQRLSLKPGDKLKAKQNDSEVNLVVGAVVGSWPGRLPEDGDFVVGSLDYFQDGLALVPYEVWVRMADGGSLTPVADALRQREVKLMELMDRRAVIAAGRREPLRLGLYATLSAGFVAALLVMALTYLLSVGLTLQSRAKELGVLRAMGMSAGHVAMSLYTEQLLLVGTAAAAGLSAGGWVAAVYVPVLRRQPGQSLLPLHTAGTAGERIWLLLGFALALSVGAGTVGLWLRRLSIGKALRLGEDG
jgi:putative ABC transport system permease protein